MTNDAPTPEKVVLEIQSDDWELILDYIYSNLEWDSDGQENREMRAAMDRIRRHVHSGDAD